MRLSDIAVEVDGPLPLCLSDMLMSWLDIDNEKPSFLQLMMVGK